jgi:SAM-dependent methyltransferase
MDIVIASYSMHHLMQTPDERQIEEALLEMNRILKKGGRTYFTFPWSAGEGTLSRFAKGMADYGFRVDVSASGAYCPLFDSGKRGKKILLLVAEKEEERAGLGPSGGWDRFLIFNESSRPKFAYDHAKKEKPERTGKAADEPKRIVGFKKVGEIEL